MAKVFEKRELKKERNVLNVIPQEKIDLFKTNDDRLLRGAKLQDLRLQEIVVKDQVRTKFNDSSIKELAENIKANGLIQPLVVHREKNKFVLICGERRYRAMSSIPMQMAPCFILENKTEEELMAIQFSENSSRENLHYIDKSDGIFNYQQATKSSERKITADLGISKSEVHRSLIIAKLPNEIKEAAKMHDIEKYVLLEWSDLPNQSLKDKVLKKIIAGEVTKRTHLQNEIKKIDPSTKIKKSRSAIGEADAEKMVEMLEALKKKKKLDPSMKELIQELADQM